MAYNYDGTGTPTGLNPNDPFAQQTQSKSNMTNGVGHAHYNTQGLRSASSIGASGNVTETIEPYVSEINRMMADYAIFLSPEFWGVEDVTYESRSVKVTSFGGYKFVDIDPTAELWHGRTRDIGEISTYMYIQRYASWLKWTEESDAYEKEVYKRNILKKELVYDMTLRVPALVAYHTIIKESGEIFGACGTADFASIVESDTIDYGVFVTMRALLRSHPKRSSMQTVVLDTFSFAEILKQIAALDMFVNQPLPGNIASAMNEDADTFSFQGSNFVRNAILAPIPKDSVDTLTGYTNSNTDVGYALILNGKFGKKGKYSKNGVGDKVVEKAYGTVDANDLLNEVASFAYKMYVSFTILDPSLATTYYFAMTDEAACGPIYQGDPAVEAKNIYTTEVNRFVKSDARGISNEITFEGPTVQTNVNSVHLKTTVRYADEALHTAMLANPAQYRAEMDMLVDQYRFIVEENELPIGEDVLAGKKLSSDRTYYANIFNVDGTLEAKIVHNQNADVEIENLDGSTRTVFRGTIVEDVIGPVVLKDCAIDGVNSALENEDEDGVVQPSNQLSSLTDKMKNTIKGKGEKNAKNDGSGNKNKNKK